MGKQIVRFAAKVAGTRGSWRRRWAVPLSLAIAVAASLLVIQTVLAVHATGALELDGDTVSLNANPPAPDWATVVPPGAPTPAPTSVAFTADKTLANVESLAATIFSGGGSKDPIDIPSWAWKDDAGGLPDKDNLLHSFAARYSLPPSASTCPSNEATCEVLYFGSDRYDNSGDAHQAFWFFQKKVTLNTTKNGGGFGFTGMHTPGDLLVISNFSNGGTTSTIVILSWDPVCTATNKPDAGCADGNLRLLASSDQALCDPTLTTQDSFCGISNPGLITLPWTFVDKSGTPGNQALIGEFFEAGVNLSALGLGDECFSSVMSETRSSTSTTATLKDFVLGQLASCGATISTTPSAGVTDLTSVSPGTSVTDAATVTGTGVTNPPDPTGNITFKICGPTAVNSTELCTSAGTTVGSPKALQPGTLNDGIATATSDAVNTGASPLAPGRYCFFASWPGDTNYNDGPYTHAGTGNSECFVVRQIPTTTVTTPSNGSGGALVSPLALGTQLFDKAVVSGTTAGGNPPGAVNFFVCAPGQTTGAAGAEVCATGGTALSGNPRTLVADAGSNPPSSSVLSSPAVVANTAGVWCFRAEYVPTGSTYTSSSDASHTECVTVSPAGTTTVTTPRAGGANISGPVAVNTSVTDLAVVTGNAAGGTPTGSVSFFVCNPSQVQGAAGAETCPDGFGSAVTGNPVALGAVNATSASATSGAVIANLVGVWCFRGVFTPSGTNAANYTGSSDASHSECFLVQDGTSLTSLQDWLPNDTATVATTGGTALNGTLTFQLYETSDCTGTPVAGQNYPFTLTNATLVADRTKKTTNTTYFVTANKIVSWKVVFAPTAGSNVTGSTHCETTSLTVNNNNPAP